MRSFEELLQESSATHGHRCAGQVLGVRMAMVGCREVEIDEPKGCKKLIVYVEMDRCATDAIQAVTGCSLGKRTLKFLDYGKMAATFFNMETRKAMRVLAKDNARELAPLYGEDGANSRDTQRKAYAVMPEELLFSIQPAAIDIPEEDLPGFRSSRVTCKQCGEGINLRREVRIEKHTYCIPCAREIFPSSQTVKLKPKIVLVVGYKKTGKTTLIEKLIPELSNRGYRVATVKHHHSDCPGETDIPGTDTWRHHKAGAKSVTLVSPNKIAVFAETDRATSLDDVTSKFAGHDIVLVEGFHLEPKAKIEVLSPRNAERLCPADENLLALVGETDAGESIPTFAPNGITPLADLIETRILGRNSSVQPQR